MFKKYINIPKVLIMSSFNNIFSFLMLSVNTSVETSQEYMFKYYWTCSGNNFCGHGHPRESC